MAKKVSDIFNPQTFFQKTANYASQGRGEFKLTNLPPVLSADAVSPTIGAFEAGSLLTRGIVAKTVSSPGSTLATFEAFSYSGPTRKHPHTQIFGPMTVEFYLMGADRGEAQSLYHTFLSWHEAIAGPRQDINSVNQDVRSDSTYFAIEYYDAYTVDAEFKVYSPQDPDNAIIYNKYFELYPITVGGIQTSWESPDAPLTLSVEFEFYYMQSQLGRNGKVNLKDPLNNSATENEDI